MSSEIFVVKYSNDDLIDEDVKYVDVRNCTDQSLREFNAFRIFSEKQTFKKYRFSGVFSPKFTKKTGLTFNRVHEFLDDDFDIILFHPYPLEFKLQNDFLHLAEYEHPGIRDAMNQLWLDLFGSTLPILNLPSAEKYICHCNYFMANQKFWRDYSSVITEICKLINIKKLEYLTYNLTTYNLGKPEFQRMALFPFVFERLLSHFIFSKSQSYSVLNNAQQNSFEQVQQFNGEKILVRILKILFFLNFKDACCPHRKSLATRIYFQVRREVFRNCIHKRK